MQDFLEPAAGGLFDYCGGGRAGVEAGVLIPGGGEPIGSKGCGQGTADDPAEESPAGRAEDTAFDSSDEIADDLFRV
jgi:hypothetical protein